MNKVFFSNSKKFAIVDNPDYLKVKGLKWNLLPNGYVKSSSRINGKQVYLHRFILNARTGEYVDHINSDKLDNRKSNIRICTQSENLFNAKKQSRNSSGFRGVYKKKTGWQVYMSVFKKFIYVGAFNTKVEAIKARKMAELKYHGEFARIS